MRSKSLPKTSQFALNYNQLFGDRHQEKDFPAPEPVEGRGREIFFLLDTGEFCITGGMIGRQSSPCVDGKTPESSS